MVFQTIVANPDIYKPELWANETLEIFEQMRGLRGEVHTDFNQIIASRGDTVNTRTPQVMAAASHNAAGGVDAADIRTPTAENVAVILDQDQHVTFELRDRDRTTSLKNLLEEFAQPAAIGLIDAVEDSGIAAITDAASGFGNAATSAVIQVGEAGAATDPAVFSLHAIATAAKEMTDRKIPMTQRYMRIAPKQKLDLMKSDNSLLIKLNESGSPSALRENMVGRLHGFTISEGQNLPTIANQANGAAAFPDGDEVLSAPFWYRNGVTYVNRPMESPPSGTGANVAVISYADQAVRASVGWDQLGKKLYVSLDLLWGWKVIRPEAGGVIQSAGTKAA